MGWVPCPLSPPPGPPTKSPVSLDPKTFEAGEGGTHCVTGTGRKIKAALLHPSIGTWFPLEITRNAGEGQRIGVLLRETSEQ